MLLSTYVGVGPPPGGDGGWEGEKMTERRRRRIKIESTKSLEDIEQVWRVDIPVKYRLKPRVNVI